MFISLTEILGIYFFTTLKFLSGPILGYAAGLNIFLTMLITATGMMTSVVIFTYFGSWLRRRLIRKFVKPRRIFSKKSRRFVSIWKKWGAGGVAFFTPILLMPIGGTILLAAAGTPKGKILLYMLISAVCWSIVQTTLLYVVGEKIQLLINN